MFIVHVGRVASAAQVSSGSPSAWEKSANRSSDTRRIGGRVLRHQLGQFGHLGGPDVGREPDSVDVGVPVAVSAPRL